MGKVNCAPKKWTIGTIALVIFQSMRVLLDRKNSILHFQTSYRNLPFLVLSPLVSIFRKKVIVSYHSGKLCERLEESLLDRLLFFYTGLISKKIIVMNDRQRQRVERLFPSLEGRIIVVHSFVFPVKKDRELEVSKIKGCFRVSSMGAWLDYYQFEDSMEAMLKLAQEKKEVNFILKFGVALFNVNPEYRKKVKDLDWRIEQQCDNLKITFEENVKDPLAFIADSDVFVRSSSVDSFGLCVAEAIFLGKPAIATDVCRRVDGVRLYRAGDVDSLGLILEEVFEKVNSGNLERIVLDEREDAFPQLLSLYREVASA